MNESSQPDNPQRMIELLGKQRDVYVRLRELSEQQRSLITGDRPQNLLNILRERQSLIAALARVNEQLAPFRRDWEGVYSNLPDDLRDQANNLLQEINGLLQVILRTDQEDSALLSARKQAAADQIDMLAGGRSANRAYAQQTAAGDAASSADLTG